ncbi:hypothetical protein [Dapis sp. BLCC M172]
MVERVWEVWEMWEVWGKITNIFTITMQDYPDFLTDMVKTLLF